MKKANLFIACTALAGAVACNNGSNTGTAASSDSGTNATTSTTNNTMTTNSDSTGHTGTTPSATATKMALNAADSTFVMKAAVGGMVEVAGGNTAQANAANARVKAYGAMMVADHGKANAELMTLASSKGITLPAALPADKQKHIDEMGKMKGKAFDSHYATMMISDHKKVIADFEKEASSGTDPDVKAWAAKTLPVLKTHLDSIQSISKMKM